MSRYMSKTNQTKNGENILRLLELKVSVRSIANILDLSTSTIKKYKREFKSKQLIDSYTKPNQILDEIQEKYLCNLIQDLNMKGNRKQIRIMAYELAVKCHVEIPEGWEVAKSASKDWYYSFVKRHSFVLQITRVPCPKYPL